MNLHVSPSAAATELLRRKRARESLIGFSQAIEVPGKPIEEDEDEDHFVTPASIETGVADHHRLLMRAFQRCVETRHGRLMVFMPPGAAKSTYASVVGPTWAMSTRPNYKVIAASYGSDLSRKLGRRCRSIVKQGGFTGLHGSTLSNESAAADEWALSNGSEYMGGGILSGITGNRAHLVVIDDPVKGRQEAESQQIRKRTIEAYEDDLKTRLVPGGSIVLIQTRWHEEDLAGSILPIDYAGQSGPILCRDGQVWEVICLPAKAERADDPLNRPIGGYLWPEWFDAKHWSQFENKPRTWASLYQQRPAPEEGDLFKGEWLRPYETAPDRSTLTVYGASDYAVTGGGGDFTVHIIVGVDPAGKLWLLDLWRAQTSSDQWVEAFCDLVRQWKPLGWAEETGQIRAGVGPFLDRRIRERNAYVVREAFPTRGDKAVRAQSIRGRMALDGLHVPHNAPWHEAFRSELLTFPTGRHDDQVDALGLLGQLLDKMVDGRKPDEPKKPTGPRDWFEEPEHEDVDWRVA